MKSANKVILVLTAFSFISCASAPKGQQKTAFNAQEREMKEKNQKSKAVKNMTNQERIYHAKFSGAFYDKF